MRELTATELSYVQGGYLVAASTTGSSLFVASATGAVVVLFAAYLIIQFDDLFKGLTDAGSVGLLTAIGSATGFISHRVGSCFS